MARKIKSKDLVELNCFQVINPPTDITGFELVECPDCKGNGSIQFSHLPWDGDICRTCLGAGEIYVEIEDGAEDDVFEREAVRTIARTIQTH